jgi:UDP-glucose 4-epimerase
MKILLTGGAGFIGSFILRYLLSDEDLPIEKIVVLDDLSTGKMDNLSPYMSDPRFDFILGDVEDNKILQVLDDDTDVVIHLAAYVDVSTSFKFPRKTYDINIGGTLNLLEFSRERDVDLFILSSSASVYGEPRSLPVREEDCCDPLSPYAVSKLAGEHYLKVYSSNYGFNGVSLRLFNVYGSYPYVTEYSGVITKFLLRVLKGEPPIIYGSGEQTRDFIHVKDVYNAIKLLLGGNINGYEVYNVGSGLRTSINTLARMVLDLSSLDLKPIYNPPRQGDIMHSQADIRKIKEDFGFKPSISLEEGLEMAFNFLKGYFK